MLFIFGMERNRMTQHIWILYDLTSLISIQMAFFFFSDYSFICTLWERSRSDRLRKKTKQKTKKEKEKTKKLNTRLGTIKQV